MPTGSLCAERNVIGTALASNPGLLREDLRMVAVLAINLEDDPIPSSLQGRAPPSALPIFCSPVATPGEIEYSSAPGESPEVPRGVSLGTVVARKVSREKDLTGAEATLEGYVAEMLELSEREKEKAGGVGACRVGADAADTDGDPSPTPVRRIRLYSGYNTENESETSGEETDGDSTSTGLYQSTKASMFDGPAQENRTVLVHSKEDLNPLKPCGACNEWLKKIAEPNPGFQVITFTDAECNGVYVRACQD